jgi:hypothetical protein
MVSTRIWRLRPVLFVPPSKPHTPPTSVVLTVWLSKRPGCLPPHLLPQGGVDRRERAVARPDVAIVADDAAVGQIMGNIIPITAGAQDVAHPVHHRPHVHRVRPARSPSLSRTSSHFPPTRDDLKALFDAREDVLL